MTLLNMYVDFLIYESSIEGPFYFCLYDFIFFRLISLFTFHLGENIRPKQRPACRSSASIRSGSILLNPSIQLKSKFKKNERYIYYLKL
jgi:hypothetical protein